MPKHKLDKLTLKLERPKHAALLDAIEARAAVLSKRLGKGNTAAEAARELMAAGIEALEIERQMELCRPKQGQVRYVPDMSGDVKHE